MQLVVITPFVEDPRHIDGGVDGVSKYLADELSKQKDIKLTVVVPKSFPGETIYEEWGKISIYRLGKKGIWSFLPGTVYDIFAGKRQIRDLLRQLNPDIVHFQGVTFLAANCEQPHVLTIHGIVEKDTLWVGRWGLRWLKWSLLKLTENYGRHRVPHIILISEYVREFLPKKGKARKTWLIENPIVDSYFKIDWHFEPGRIFCCGKVVPRKNTLGIIKAFIQISNSFPMAQLRIAGSADPHYLHKCKTVLKTNKLQHRVHFLGNLSIESVQKEFSKANCLVLASFQETAPLVIEEAMAVGVPVVGSRICGIPFMIEEGKTGYLIDPYSTKEIAEAVTKILTDDPLAISMSKHAKEIARRRFKASEISKQTLKVYHEILAETC